MERQYIKPVKINIGQKLHTCQTCGNQFKGKICNNCGEKIFDKEQLSVKHFFHEVVEMFTHFERNVFKTIWLNFTKPGFITKQNIEGIRIPYAKPVQLFLIVNVFFYFFVSWLGARDYIPSFGDEQYNPLSIYTIFHWAKPFDEKVANAIDTMASVKISARNENNIRRIRTDSIYEGKLDSTDLKIVQYHTQRIFFATFNQEVEVYSKTFIFILIPFIAFFFFIFFYKHLKYYGAALIYACHFLTYNLIIYCLWEIINFLPHQLYKNIPSGIAFTPFDLIFYNKYTAPVSNFIFSGGDFEFTHQLLWIPWLFIANKRLFNLKWWQNIIASYFLVKIIYWLIFGGFKKFIIWYTLYKMS